MFEKFLYDSVNEILRKFIKNNERNLPWLFSLLFVPTFVIFLNLSPFSKTFNRILAVEKIKQYELNSTFNNGVCNADTISIIVLQHKNDYELPFEKNIGAIRTSIKDSLFSINYKLNNIVINQNYLKIPSSITGIESEEIIIQTKNKLQKTVYVNKKPIHETKNSDRKTNNCLFFLLLFSLQGYFLTSVLKK